MEYTLPDLVRKNRRRTDVVLVLAVDADAALALLRARKNFFCKTETSSESSTEQVQTTTKRLARTTASV